MRRLLGLVLVIASGACGEDPKPLTATVRWIDDCLREGMGRTGGPHVITGTNSSAGKDIKCTMSQEGALTRIEFLAVTGDNIDASSEAVFFSGEFAAVGRSAENSGQAAFRGTGWGVSRSAIVGQNPTAFPCEFQLTSADLSTRSFSGRFKCAGLRADDMVPPRICAVRGQNNLTRDAEWGDFTFSNCNAPD